jgi:3-oxoacyl-[acyl-carrier-protein] synthase III
VSIPSPPRLSSEQPLEAPHTTRVKSGWAQGASVSVLGLGAYVPARVLSNADLERLLQTSDEWIRTRTGIAERRMANPGEATSDLAVEAGRRALASAGINPYDLELIVLATATPDSPVPATVSHVQRKLGAQRATGFDIGAGCTGFVVALMTAHSLVATGGFHNALVIGAEVLTSIADYRRRDTCILLGDGAGAMVIGTGASGPVLIDHLTGLDGSGSDLIRVVAGGSRCPTSLQTVERGDHYLTMRGQEVFRFAVTKVPVVIREILRRNEMDLDEVALIVPHQANLRMLEAVARDLDISLDRFAINIDRFGNTSSASIPIALEEAQRAGRIARGAKVLLVAFGAGMTWGVSLVSW